MDAISRLCDHVVVLAEGRRLAEGRFAELAANPVGAGSLHGAQHDGPPEAAGVVAGYTAADEVSERPGLRGR